MAVVSEREELEAKRIQSGLNLAKVARKAAVSYQRLWRFFAFMGELDEDELERVRAVLSATPLQERAEQESVSTLGGSPVAAEDSSTNEDAARTADGTSR